MSDEYDMDVLDEIEHEYPGEKHFSIKEFISNHRIAIIICIAIFIFSALLVVSLSVILPVIFTSEGNENHSSSSVQQSSEEESSQESSYDEDIAFDPTESTSELYFGSRIKNTTESQIDINDTDEWVDRDARVREWNAITNEASVYLDTNLAQVEQNTRIQQLLSPKLCSSNYEFRTRVNIDGDSSGDGYIDIKGNNNDMEKACTMPFDIAPIYQTNSSQKCELDLHECKGDDKYSRESRVFFKNYFPEIETCKDLLNIYPNCFPTIVDGYYDAALSVRSTQTWWANKFTGILDDDTRYEITFTLRYHSTEDALAALNVTNGIKPASGEWSIRLYSLGDGFTDEWNADVVADIAAMYKTLMEKKGRPGHCD